MGARLSFNNTNSPIKGGKRFKEVLSRTLADMDKDRSGAPRKSKLNRHTKSKINYKRRWSPEESKVLNDPNRYVFIHRYRGTVRFLADREGMTINQMEFILHSAAFKYFYAKEILEMMYLPKSFMKKEFQALRRDGYIQVYKRQHKRSGKGDLFVCSYKSNKMVTNFYKLLLGEIELPEYAGYGV